MTVVVVLASACSKAPPPAASAGVEAAKATVGQLSELVWNQGKLERLGEFYAENVVRHVPERPAPIVGLAANQAYIRDLQAAFPDGRIETVRMLGEGDWLAVQWMWTGTQTGNLPGLPATGKPVRLEGVSLVRHAHGKAVEIWDFDDQFGMLQQLGVIPAPPAAT
jgi:predicted ester cyclase